MTWSEQTAEIILATETGIIMIDPVTKNSREFSITQGIGSSGMVLDSNLYFVDYFSVLSALNLSTMTFKTAIVDSIKSEQGRMAINSKHFAYAKYLSWDSDTMYLYEYATGTEKPLTKGMPCQFSPDGSKLLFIRDANFYSYDLKTQSVELVTEVVPPTFGAPPRTMRWRPEGILSYSLSDNGFEVINESTKQRIARWQKWFGIRYVSQSGNKVMVMEQRCTDPAQNGNCPQFQFFGSVLDITTKIEKDLIHSPQLLLFTDVTFIRNETAIVYLIGSNSLYLVEIED